MMLAFDGDDAGEQATAWWLERLSGSRRLRPDGDPSAMLEAGEDLRGWVEEGLS